MMSCMSLYITKTIYEQENFFYRNNPRNPCPCTFNQAWRDRRFAPLYSESYYEYLQGVFCFGPLTTSWVRVGWYFKPLRSQVNQSECSCICH